jgi:hypothetical protein
LVNQELIDQLYIKETGKIREFFMSSFFTESGSIMLQPTGWKLDDNLKESVTIRAFSTFAKQIVFLFSATKYILWLYIGAFLLFLQGFFFRKQTKKDIIVDAIGFVLLCLIFTVGEYYF